MQLTALEKALNRRVIAYTDSLEVVARVADDDETAREAARTLREAIELVRCLRRLLPACTVEQIHGAFGAPGDFGYETPIGEALAQIYGLL